jgi:hypothetical protein
MIMTQVRKKTRNPLPLAPRICVCGCENEFQPSRSNQIYFDTIHANHGYNKGPRKKKYAKEQEVTKVIRKNDRTLEKYFRISRNEAIQLNLLIVQADGFDLGYFTKVAEKIVNRVNTRFHALYKYCYRIIKQGDVDYIEIREL